MKRRTTKLLPAATAGLLALCCVTLPRWSHAEPPQGLGLSADVMALLRAEMRELTTASQALVPAIAGGDWASIERISGQIRDSYVMAQSLTPAQREELETRLPDHFKALDADFHNRASKLAAAAEARDADLAAYQFSRLLDTCTSCHARYAGSRFPGFSSPRSGHHPH